MDQAATFGGFPPAAMDFLHEIRENNNREWFAENKPTYVDSIQRPAQQFIGAMGHRLQSILPDINYDTKLNGSGSLMRIYRDVRFSRDKTPYKTNVGIIFWEGLGKKTDKPGFYLGFDADGGGAYAGLWGFNKEFLSAYREAVDEDKLGKGLIKAIAKVKRVGDYEIEPEMYKRIPRGYDADHPREELLRYKGMGVASPKFDLETITSPDFIDLCYEHFKAMLPIQQWLVQVDKRVG